MASVVMAALALAMAGAALFGALLLWSVLRAKEPPKPTEQLSDEELQQWWDFLNYKGGETDED